MTDWRAVVKPFHAGHWRVYHGTDRSSFTTVIGRLVKCHCLRCGMANSLACVQENNLLYYVWFGSEQRQKHVMLA
jgi:hypothetical protein